MGVTLHSQTGQTALRLVVEENRLEHEPAPTLNQNWEERTALALGQTLKKENVTLKNAQLMVDLHHILTIQCVPRLVVQGFKHALDHALIHYHCLEEGIVLELMWSHENATHNPAQSMVGLLNGATIPPVLLLVVEEIRCV